MLLLLLFAIVANLNLKDGRGREGVDASDEGHEGEGGATRTQKIPVLPHQSQVPGRADSPGQDYDLSM